MKPPYKLTKTSSEYDHIRNFKTGSSNITLIVRTPGFGVEHKLQANILKNIASLSFLFLKRILLSLSDTESISEISFCIRRKDLNKHYGEIEVCIYNRSELSGYCATNCYKHYKVGSLNLNRVVSSPSGRAAAYIEDAIVMAKDEILYLTNYLIDLIGKEGSQ